MELICSSKENYIDITIYTDNLLRKNEVELHGNDMPLVKNEYQRTIWGQ